MCHKSVERTRTTVRITRLYRFGIQDRSSNWKVYKKKKKRKVWNTNNLTNICTYVFYGVEQVVNLHVNNRHITSKENNFFFYTVNYLHYWHNDESISLILFFFCQTFVELYLFKRKKFCLWQIEIIIESNLIKRKNSFELMKRLFFIHYIIRSLFFFFRRKIWICIDNSKTYCELFHKLHKGDILKSI